MNTVKIKLLDSSVKIPTKGSKYSAGYDLYSGLAGGVIVPPHETVKIGTGIAMQIPEGHFGAIFARSGIATKRGLRPSNAVGIVDSDYTGEVIVALHNDTDFPQEVKAHERIAQLVVIPYLNFGFEVVDELDETERGDGGFGSTGKQ